MKDFPVVKFTAAFAVGILLAKIIFMNYLFVAVFSVLLLGSFIISIKFKTAGKYTLFFSAASLILIILIGNLYAQVSGVKFNPALTGIYNAKNVKVTGEVTKIELSREDEILFHLKSDSLIINDTKFTDDVILLCKLKGGKKGRAKFYSLFKPGNIVEVTGNFRKGNERRNPGEFDYNAYLKSKGIIGILTIKKYSDIKLIIDKTNIFNNTIFQIRKSIDEQLKILYNDQTVSLLKGLLLADRREIDRETKTMFINSGVVHVLAVSGLHVGFIALIFLFLFGRFNVYLRSALTIAGLLIFMFVTGVPPSVFRATVMAVVIIIAFLTNRSSNIFNSLAIAALIILALNPNELYSPGFQLSFSAVISIAAIYPLIENYLRRKNIKLKYLRYLLLFMGVSFAAQIGTLPFTLIYFGKISIIALAANIVVIPAIGIIIGLAFISLFFNLFAGFIAVYYASANELITKLLFRFIDFAGSLNFSFVKIINYSIYDAVVFYFFLIFFLLSLKKFTGRIAKLILLILIIINVIVFTMLDNKKLLPDNKLSILMIDTGQGDSFLIKFPDDEIALVDAGAAAVYFDYGERVITPLLNYLGIDKIDYGFISHIDNDHYGGFISLVMNNMIEKIYKPAVDSSLIKDTKLENFLNIHSVPVEYYDSQIIKIGNCRLYVLNAKDEAEYFKYSSNERSGIFKLVYGNVSLLFTGDLEQRIEKRYVKNYRQFLNVDILKVGHHGSKTSTSVEFLNYTTPRYALISVGIQNKFGHPDEKVLNRLNGKNIQILRTDLSGAILLETDGKNIFMDDWKKN
ncbi:comEC family competence protein [bacterium BMS3Abin03]|nr:comEC family competence protein [bacterium BMS3Abin03]